MSYQLISTIQYNVNEYAIDDKEDLKTLPFNCRMGSRAICINNGEVYIKNSKGEWKILDPGE